MRRFKSPGHAQRFLAAYGRIIGHCRPRRHRLTVTAYRQHRHDAFATWREVAGVAGAARSTGWLGPSTPTNDPRTAPQAQVDNTDVPSASATGQCRDQAASKSAVTSTPSVGRSAEVARVPRPKTPYSR